MRYIKIIGRCQEFDDYIAQNADHMPKKWDNALPGDIKTALHNHLLKQQQGLCIYCQKEIREKKILKSLSEDERKLEEERLLVEERESKEKGIPTRISIIEHIRPKDKDKYPELTFVLCNLSVACNRKNKKDSEYCEDRKHNKYDENNFLNPFEVTDIESYFEYDTEGRIIPKNDNEKAKYMINDVLDLDNFVLRQMRKNQYILFSKMDIQEAEEILLDEDTEQLPQFYSMLKQRFYLK